MATTVPACKAAVLALLAARPALTGVVLTWAGPTKDEDFTEEMIFLGDTDRTSDWAELGAGRRVESYSLTVTVYVEQWGDDPQAAEQRAYALLDEVEDTLRDDIRAVPSTLRTAGVFQFDGMSDHGSAGPSTPEKWGARIDARADFQARNV
jgi:hypothetical protein